ncbi:Lysophospholipid acyltransferase LPEAT2 [Camellia lanceoleosa]|uniref:Lysophospholipid acyltransferase LPEAT2 n=1 Tax=Camellia lanceoleosa TaxID=1840588 RepID=A0ACC0ICP1_9ERIC|nr:Lysophospholipid acyltransferase LPEAT2 [Camellia lanceoleosa]
MSQFLLWVEYLPVVSPLENQKENAVHFAKRTGHAIATALNVVQTGHAYEDFMLFAKAAKSKQENPTLYMIEMKKVESTFHLRSLEAMDFLDTFLSTNPNSSGHVKIHDFSMVLRLKACSLSEKFLYGSAHVSRQPLFRQASELAFTECHADGNHYISEQEEIPLIKRFQT